MSTDGSDRPAPRRLQQQPTRGSDPQQQRAGATEFQSEASALGGASRQAPQDSQRGGSRQDAADAPASEPRRRGG